MLATFFVVGSRVIERPAVVVDEYMQGHEISVHTWSHRVRPFKFVFEEVINDRLQPLTSLTNEQIVAELGWTRKAIKTVLGVTPTTMRPPFGDIGMSPLSLPMYRFSDPTQTIVFAPSLSPWV